MSRLFGYTAAAVDRDTAAIEAFENKKIEAKENYWFVLIYLCFRKLHSLTNYNS